MKTPPKGRHGTGAPKHATSAPPSRRPHTESRATGADRPRRFFVLKDVLAALGTRKGRVILLAAGGVALLAAVMVTLFVVLPGRAVRVPDLVGVPRAEAAARLTSLGLVLSERDTRFSATAAKGSVATQEPTAGTLVAPGSTIVVDLSAGSESFVMPDVVGQDLDAARAALRAKGLSVTFGTASSEVPSGTVIASAPAAGTSISTGDIVRLTVAVPEGAVGAADLTGVAFVLDPAPPSRSDDLDVSMDVATRVSGLLTAAGAQVTLTRPSRPASPAVTPAQRVRIAKETSATALIGFSVAPSNLEGMVLMTMPSTAETRVQALSGPLADAMFASLAVDVSTISTVTAAGDTVLIGSGLPGVRVRLGSYASSTDAKSFSNQKWLEAVAGDIYRALAGVYGRR